MLSQCVQSFFFSLLTCIQLCVWCLCVWGGWTKAMCLVRSHTNGVSLYKSREQQTIKCTKCALWVTDLPHLHQHLAWLPKVTGHSSRFTRALWDQHNEVGTKHYSVFVVPLRKQNIRSIPRISSRGTGSAFYISQHERRVSPRKPFQYQKRLFAINVHCKKKRSFYLYTVFCASLFLLLCWTSPLDSLNFKRSVKCWIDPARLGFCALLSTI